MLKNAPSPIEVTPSGTKRDDALQDVKAFSSIVVTDFGIVILANDVHI